MGSFGASDLRGDLGASPETPGCGDQAVEGEPRGVILVGSYSV